MIYTPWFPVSVPPVRKGWYEVHGSFVDSGSSVGIVKRYWTGKLWKWKSVYTHRMTYAAVSANCGDKWRGLANPALFAHDHKGAKP